MMLQQKALVELQQMQQQNIQSSVEVENQQDYIGSEERSCCFIIPIRCGVTLIGILTIIQYGLLIWQIHGVDDDGSSDHNQPGTQFYTISYVCVLPFFVNIITFLRYWLCCKGDQVRMRKHMMLTNKAIFYSVLALYLWFLLYFSTVAKHDFI